MKDNHQKTPQLRVVVTPHCNFHCMYCQLGGEGYYENIKETMSLDEIVSIISLCSKIGFRYVKFTGGEPFLREDIIELMSSTRKIPDICDVQLVTNGSLLNGRISELKNVGLDMITISLDSLESRENQQIKRSNVSSIVESIQECRLAGLPVRINMVVMKSNLDQVKSMIELSSRTGSSLKLLDLIYFPSIDRFWRNEYLHFDVIRNRLERWGARPMGLEEAPGGIGAPLTEYRMPDNTKIVLKDSTRGTFYHKSCEDCRNFPCQDAIISVRVTHDGHLKRCLIRNDNLVSILPMVREGRTDDAMQAIRDTFRIMTESQYYPFAWKPENYLSGEVPK